MNKISVIIPVYNVENYIQDCLDSVRNQSLEDLEILCINDSSTDHSFDIVKKAAEEDPRIRCIENEKNLGLASTRNRGMELAQGEYVYFLDSDDMIRQNAMQELYEQASAEQLDAVVFASEMIYESEELREQFKRDRAGFTNVYPGVLEGKELFLRWMDPWEWVPLQQRYFYRRSFLEKHAIRFADGELHEDEAFAFDVLMHAQRIRISGEPYFIRRFRANSIMSSHPTMRNVEGCLEILRHTGAFSTEDSDLKKAIRFYMYKIFRETIRKYRVIRSEGGSTVLSEKAGQDPVKKHIFSLVEACGLWENV